MTASANQSSALSGTGGCLCGAVRFELRGPLRDVVLCHCAMCRETHGHVAAYTAVSRAGLALTEQRGLRWFRSSPIAQRGFCAECGASLFWDGAGRDTISIAAGVLDPPTGLKTVIQLHAHSASDYYRVEPDIPRRAQ